MPDGYAVAPHRLVEAAPTAWTADVPAALSVPGRAELGPCCLAAVAALGYTVAAAFLCAGAPVRLLALTFPRRGARTLPGAGSSFVPATVLAALSRLALKGADSRGPSLV
ncbi:hypothetical protein JCM13580A_63390 [Streptomyces drozdowiczii]